MRKVLAASLLLVSTVALGNDQSYRSVQSGSANGGTPLYDNGIHGEGQIIAFLDTGVDYRICYFAEGDGSAPPVNTGTPGGGFAWTNINLNRRKIIAYDFLYSCDQFPGVAGCDNPGGDVDLNYDNTGHGTHTAASAAGDRDTAGAHDYEDGLALASKLIIQDAGFVGGDNCSQRPGIGCPVNMTPILDQAYKQGARIHSNSWGDYQSLPGGSVPTANYSESARQVDAFVFSHPDLLVVFNTGNLLVTPSAPASAPGSSLSAPGDAKNTLQVGGSRTQFRS
ncbi:MAG: putative peptidase, domain repeat-containing, partial [Acidobacteria bacterium]|nr:putative peptidase, domain repeat-containing [Acidobacteriota bacterium]